MRELIVTSTDTRRYSVASGEQYLGEVSYVRWHFYKATFTLANGKTFDVGSTGFWRRDIVVKDGDSVLLKYRYGWNGSIRMTALFDGYEREFIFKRKSLFSNAYVLTDKEKQELAVVRPDFKWRKFRSDYTITGGDVFRNEEQNTLLFLSIVHCTIYMLRATASAGGAS